MRVGSFGQTIFEVSADRVLSPTAFSREVKARYEEHKVLGAPPRLEFLAGELPNMELSVRFHASFGVNPLAECKKLEAACLGGKVEKLIIGGTTWGDMVLESISENARHTGAGSAGGVAMFRKTHGMGRDFMVLSHPKNIDYLPRFEYVTEL